MAMPHRVAFLHTSPAAIPPLMRYFGDSAPDFEVTNLLEDGLLRLLASGQADVAERRLTAMLEAARTTYGAEAVVVTCSSVPQSSIDHLRGTSALPVMKIDDPMAREAVRLGNRIGVAVTFPPSLEATSALLRRTAQAEGRTLELVSRVMPEAYDALLSGKPDLHDEVLAAGVRELAGQGVDTVVLAQVSMARVLPLLEGRVGVPVLSSLSTSLTELRRLVGPEHGEGRGTPGDL